jgi:DNA polymerase I-like protein with 3'-5' exonuclease and polymerase domains
MNLTDLKVLVLDFETYDPHLLTHGAGWAFKIAHPDYDFKVLCVGLRLHTGEEICIDFVDDNRIKSYNKLYSILLEHDAIVCHNAGYDIGILRYLYGTIIGPKKWLFLDTQVLAKFLDQQIDEKFNTKSPYSLDTLTRFFKLGEVKETSIVTNYAWESGMYQEVMNELTGRKRRVRPSESVLSKFCYLRLEKFPKEIREEYCMQDIKATWSLYEFLTEKLLGDLSFEEYRKLSLFIFICIECKERGVRIDLTRTRELIKEFSIIRENTRQDIIEHIIDKLGLPYLDININSTQQLSESLIALGYDVPITDKGNPSITRTWLEAQSIKDTLCNKIITYRKTLKMTRDFLDKTIDYQKVIPGTTDKDEFGILHLSLKPFGAFKTGRSTSGGGSGCKELSIHQIPRRDEEFGKPIREIFLPFEGEELICGDFNGQESRLQVHYASVLNCSGVKEIISRWWKEPEMKFYTMVSEQTKLDYDDAKMITLGLSYGMGSVKLCNKLGLAVEEGTKLIKQYHNMLPFLKELQNLTADALSRNGYIRTIGKRKLFIDSSYTYNGRTVTQERKALSKLIQGSAADQCVTAMISAYESGLKILFSVHDEIVVSSKDADNDITTLKNNMENSYKLSVPVVADCNIGSSWGEAK